MKIKLAQTIAILLLLFSLTGIAFAEDNYVPDRLFEGTHILAAEIVPAPHYGIYTISDLRKMESQSNSDAFFTLMNDIEITDETWQPIGPSKKPFSGTFDGNNHTITFTKNVTFQYPVNSDSTGFGLFGNTKYANISNLTLAFNGNAVGGNNTGALVGIFNSSQNSIANCTVQSSNHKLLGNNTVGGLVGYFGNGVIENCSSDFSVKINGNNAGGLVGYVFLGNISNSTATGSVEANKNAGGFVGSYRIGNVLKCSATGSVKSTENAGGFIGYVSDEIQIENSFANGSVKPAGAFGNFIGDWGEAFPNVINCYYEDEKVDLMPVVEVEICYKYGSAYSLLIAITILIFIIAFAVIAFYLKKKSKTK